MTDEQHRELAQVLHGAGGMVVLSGYACELYDRELYANWLRVERKSFADGARARVEVLWLNAVCVAALEAGRSQQQLIGMRANLDPTSTEEAHSDG